MSDKLLWPTARELRLANTAGRLIEIEKNASEREKVLTDWRNYIHTVLTDVVENKFQEDCISVPAPTKNLLLAKHVCPILVAWLRNMLPGFQVTGDEADYVSIVIAWREAV